MLSSLIPGRGEGRCESYLESMNRHLDQKKEPPGEDTVSPEYLRSVAVELNNAGADYYNVCAAQQGGCNDADVDVAWKSMDAVMKLFKESVSTMMDAGKDPEPEQRSAQDYKKKLEMLVDAKMAVYKKRQGSKENVPPPARQVRELRDLMLFRPDSVLDFGTQYFDEAIKAQQYDDKQPVKTEGSPKVSVGSAAVFNMGLLQLSRSQIEDDDGLLEAAMKLFRMSLGVAVAAQDDNSRRDDSSGKNRQAMSSTAIFRDRIFAQTNLGHGLYALGRFGEALACFEDALSYFEGAGETGTKPKTTSSSGCDAHCKRNNEAKIYDMAKNIFPGLEDEKCSARPGPGRQQEQAAEDVTALALIWLNIGRTHFAEGNISQATEAFKKALKSIQSFCDENEVAQDLAALRTALTYNLGFVYHEQGRWKEARRLLREFLEEVSDGRTSEAITALNKMLLMQLAEDDDAAAAKEISDVILHLEQAQDQVGYDHVGLCSILRCVGTALMERGEHGFAVRYFLEALRIERRASEETGGLSQDVVVTLNSIGECHHMAEDLDKAAEFYETAIRLQGHFQDVDDEAQRSRLKFIFSVVLYNNGRVKYEQGQQQASDELFGSAAAMVEDVGSTFRDSSRLSECAALQHNIGQYKLELGRTSDARRCFESSLGVRLSVLGRDDPAVAESLYQLGKLYHGMGDNAGALRAFDESLRIERKAFGESHPNVAMTLYNMAQIRYSTCELEVALEMFRDVLFILHRNPSDALSLGEVYGLIGSIQGELGLVNEARISLAASARHGGGRIQDDNFMCASSLVELASTRPAAAA